MSAERRWTDEMGEISGFGGGYEASCRAMVLAGLDWLDAHPDADPQFHGFRGIYGVIAEDNADAEALTRAVMDATVTDPDTGETLRAGEGATGAMHQATISAVLWIRRNGWDRYVEEMSKREAEEAESTP